MRIGILTFQRALNYGAILQIYALQETLKSFGHQVEVIDYRQPFIENIYSPFYIKRYYSKNPIRIIKLFIKDVLTRRERIERRNKFAIFISTNLLLSSTIAINSETIPGDYDVYVHGSDQIWNAKLTGGYDLVFFGEYKTKSESIKLTYAASMEANSLSETEKQLFTKYLEKFNYISVREKSLINILQPLTKNRICNVVDPTLLADPSIWDNIIVKPNIKNKYVLIYQNGVNENTLKIANNIANQIGATVIQISSWINTIDTNRSYPTPGEFIGYLKYADCIITTSYHGTTFALIFKRPFYTIVSGEKSDIRYISLLDSLGLNQRIISNGIIPQFSEINYSENVNNKLNEYRHQSFLFLQRCSLLSADNAK